MAVALAIEQLEPGMVLAEPIFNRLGQILLNKGVTITERHLNVLTTWGILQVLIEARESGERPIELNEEMKKRILSKLQKRLLWSPKSPLEEEIFHLAFLQICQCSRKETDTIM